MDKVLNGTLLGARAGCCVKKMEDSLRDFVSRIPNEQETPANSEIKKCVLASFGVDSGHIDRYRDTYIPVVGEEVPEYRDEIRQIDILQEECAELIQVLSKLKRLRDREYNDYIPVCEEDEFKNKWQETRANLVEELTHVAISSAVVSRIFNVSQSEIDAEVQRKDNLLPKNEIQSAWEQFWEGVKNLPDTKD